MSELEGRVAETAAAAAAVRVQAQALREVTRLIEAWAEVEDGAAHAAAAQARRDAMRASKCATRNVGNVGGNVRADGRGGWSAAAGASGGTWTSGSTVTGDEPLAAEAATTSTHLVCDSTKGSSQGSRRPSLGECTHHYIRSTRYRRYRHHRRNRSHRRHRRNRRHRHYRHYRRHRRHILWVRAPS